MAQIVRKTLNLCQEFDAFLSLSRFSVITSSNLILRASSVVTVTEMHFYISML